jgi:predicted  nucleic acid-binding Zn-ribbon protein
MHIARIDDRLELVQAERTRHNERLNEITTELTRVDNRLGAHDERLALTETRMGAYQDDLRKLRETLQLNRDQLDAYLLAYREMEAEIRKRQIAALEKEIRDIRGRALNLAEE